MPLSVGDKIGPYEILAALGAGGMGEVYRARDGKLNREIAIKVLPASLANDAQYMARFEREAQMLAALNHPNIATVYGIEQGALAMELVEGADLKGPLPLDEAIAIARQIAAGLEAAHERGIIHRDLKPANIKLTPAGVVKILDFGLAKSANETSTASGANATISPTLSLEMTRAGMILGTAAYMSPEQARGKVVDKRTDIWAFGAVLYEIVTGKRLFQGEDLTETLASVVKDKPDLSDVPVQVRRLIERCLEKDPRKRLRDAGDIDLLLANEGEAGRSIASPASVRRVWLWPAIAAVAAIVAGVLGFELWRATRPVDRPLVRMDVDLGADVALPPFGALSNGLALSPDGTRLAYDSRATQPPKIFVRRLDQAKATELWEAANGMSLATFDQATTLFFSPDGQWLGFNSGGKAAKVSVDGSAVVPLGDGGLLSGASWGEDGSIVMGQSGRGLIRASANGATEPLLGLADGELAHFFPQILPGGKAILFTAAAKVDPDQYTIEVFTLGDRHRKVVARGGGYGRYVATSSGAGYLLYTNRATLFAMPFDLEKLETRGPAVPLLDDVGYGPGGVGMFSVSSDGKLVYRPRNGRSRTELQIVQWVDSTGKREPLGLKPDLYQDLTLSPDGKRIALLIGEPGNNAVWVYDRQRDGMTRLSFERGSYSGLVWSLDGQYIFFGSVNRGTFAVRADGGSQPQQLLDGKLPQAPSSFSPDGRRLAYFDFKGTGVRGQIWTAPVQVPLPGKDSQWRAGEPERFLQLSNSYDQQPKFSPDGRWLAYSSSESGKLEVYVRAFPHPASGPGGKWQISIGGGITPEWSHITHELLYQSGADVMAANYSVKGDVFVLEKRRVWLANLGSVARDLAPDGKRLAILTPVGAPESPKPDHEIVFLENFFDELRRKVPAAK